MILLSLFDQRITGNFRQDGADFLQVRRLLSLLSLWDTRLWIEIQPT